MQTGQMPDIVKHTGYAGGRAKCKTPNSFERVVLVRSGDGRCLPMSVSKSGLFDDRTANGFTCTEVLASYLGLLQRESMQRST